MGRNSSLKERLREKIQEPYRLLNDLFQAFPISTPSANMACFEQDPLNTYRATYCTASPNLFWTLIFLCMKNRQLIRHATTGGHTNNQSNVYCARSEAPKAPGLARLIILSRVKRLSRAWCQRPAKSAGLSILAYIAMASALTSSSVRSQGAFCVSRQHRKVSTLWSYFYGFRFFAVVKCSLQ